MSDQILSEDGDVKVFTIVNLLVEVDAKSAVDAEKLRVYVQAKIGQIPRVCGAKVGVVSSFVIETINPSKL